MKAYPVTLLCKLHYITNDLGKKEKERKKENNIKKIILLTTVIKQNI